MIIAHCRNNHGKGKRLRFGFSRLPPQRRTHRDEINEPKIETDDLHCRLNTDQKNQHKNILC
jgi:hypothetical protein